MQRKLSFLSLLPYHWRPGRINDYQPWSPLFETGIVSLNLILFQLEDIGTITTSPIIDLL